MIDILEFFFNENLNWKTPINEISTKLVISNAMLSKLWHFVNKAQNTSLVSGNLLGEKFYHLTPPTLPQYLLYYNNI